MKAVYLKDKTGNKVVAVPYYRVGDIFLTTIATNPSNYLGGKWELFGPGRCLVCVDTSQTEFNSVKKTGGSKYTQAHNHTMNPSGSHSHWTTNRMKGAVLNWDNSQSGQTFFGHQYQSGSYKSSAAYDIGQVTTSTDGNHSHTINNYGSGDSQNLQPFITCYVWIRIA